MRSLVSGRKQAQVPQRGGAASGGASARSEPAADGWQRGLVEHVAQCAVQRLAAPTGSAAASPLDDCAVTRTAAAGVQGAGTSLPHLARLQRSFAGHELGHIRAFTGVAASAAAADIGAQAYAFGDRIAFADRCPSVQVVAHEVTHTLQQRGGVQLKGGVGAAGDPYERQADAVGAAVARGESVAALLGPLASAAPRSARPAVQRLSVDDRTAKAVKARINARKGSKLKGNKTPPGKAVEIGLDDRFYSFEQDQGLAAFGVASMADDPKFEAEAERFEARIGSLAYNHPRAKKVCKDASAKVLAYVRRKHRDARDSAQRIDADLQTAGIDKADWSGAVGKSVAAITKVFTSGSVSEQVAHVESFVCNVLNVDLMNDAPGWQTHAGEAGLDLNALAAAEQRVQGTDDRYLAYEVPHGGASAIQWHTRIGVGNLKRETGQDTMPLHPSAASQRTVDNDDSSTTSRKRAQIEKPFPLGLGVTLGSGEAAFQEAATGGKERLKWAEGARIWALNELDQWVHTQRTLSLPLAAGASSTAARIMQSFAFLGVGPPDDVRLAAIGALLPARHHSLVEVMFAARPFGATPYPEGAAMYHNLAPLTEQEVRAVAKFYPDETIDSVYPAPPGPPPPPPLPALAAPLPALAAPLPARPLPRALAALHAPVVDREQQALQGLTGDIRGRLPRVAPTFVHTRRTLDTQGISTFFTDRNSSQARMLRAIDAYHATQASDVVGRLRLLTRVRDEAAHWLQKRGRYNFKMASTITKFKKIRDDAAAVIQDHEDRYMLDLASDEMLADSHHAYQGLEQAKAGGEAQRLIREHGLTAAEVAAIATYVGPSYKFINAGLEKDKGRMMGRLMGFVSETKQSFSTKPAESAAAARKARMKLRGVRDKKQGAIDEAQRHAVVATLGLDKLPAYNGLVYAGGALTVEEAEKRFVTGQVQSRAAFASTTSQKMTANIFAATKWTEVNDAYEADPKPGKAPFAYVLQYQSRTGRDIEAFSHKPEEHEVLFAPNSKLRITRGAKQARQDPDSSKCKIIEAEEVV